MSYTKQLREGLFERRERASLGFSGEVGRHVEGNHRFGEGFA